MPKIVLDLNKDLITHTESNQLRLKRSPDSGNTLQIINGSSNDSENGLYAEAKNGSDGSGGSGYGTQVGEGVLVGYDGPYSTKTVDRRVSNTSYVHHVFESNNAAGTSLKNFRSDIDYVLPGDMYIHEGKIYLVISVTQNGKDGNYGTPGNAVSSSVQIGVM